MAKLIGLVHPVSRSFGHRRDCYRWNYSLLDCPCIESSIVDIRVGTSRAYICRTTVQQRGLRIALGILCIFIISAAVWKRPQKQDLIPSARPWLRLTEDERQKFIAVLASQTEPRERVRLGCPAANEEICILVTPFIDAFKRGHFIVENDRIERVTLGKPTGGVVLFKYGHADAFNPQDPDQGVWVNISPSLATVENAFAEIGINAMTSADKSLPQDVIAVYFGIESMELRDRHNLRELRQQTEQQYGKPILSPTPSTNPSPSIRREPPKQLPSTKPAHKNRDGTIRNSLHRPATKETR